MFGRLRENWKSFSSALGNYQSRLLLGVFYFLVVTPFGVAIRMLGDPLHLRQAKGSCWALRQTPPLSSLEESKKQF